MAGPPGTVTADTTSPEEDYATMKVFYGTNRVRQAGRPPNKMYGSSAGPLELGVLRVSVPLRGRKAGSIPRPSILKLQFHEDPRKHIVLAAVTPLSQDDWTAELRTSVGSTSDSAMLIFVHGFNVSFREAAWRAGELAYDLGFNGATALYSWPSKGEVEAYTVDQTTAAESAPPLADFLSLIVTRSGARRIHLVAHSMGNMVLAEALEEMSHREELASSAKAPAGGQDSVEDRDTVPLPWFNHVVMAAPDIDEKVFAEQLFPRIRGTAQDWTLYASSRDLALGVSTDVAGHQRLGLIEGREPMMIEGVLTVDASVVKGDMLGHSYYAQLPLLDDLHDLIELGATPSKRHALLAHGSYWVLKWKQ
jgi:esterase/lipase superfamily enzyme